MSYVEKCEYCKEAYACFHMQGKPCETEQARLEADTDHGICDRCGGDGMIEYNDGDGGDWGEDCPSEVNHLITCRACNGTGKHR